MKFILEIELGNDAMLTANEVARALKEEARLISLSGHNEPLTEGFHRIRDINGNTVGKWEVTED